MVDNRLSGSNTTTDTYDPANSVASAAYPKGLQSTFTYGTLNWHTVTQNLAVTSLSSQFAGLSGCCIYGGFGNRKPQTFSALTTTPCTQAAEDSVQRGLYRNPYLMEQPDRADPAACFVGVTGWVFRGLLRQH